jgi:molybdenum cofactor cytidylyltransferase
MGSDNKLLLAWNDGKPVIRHVVDSATSSGVGPVHVVTGKDADAVAKALDVNGCHLVHNASFQSGMASSLSAGFGAAATTGVSGVIVMLGDMPLVGPELIQKVHANAMQNPHRIVQPVFEGRPAHPVWLPARLAGAIAELEGDAGAGGLIANDSEPVVRFEATRDAVVDLDTEEAYEAALQLAGEAKPVVASRPVSSEEPS